MAHALKRVTDFVLAGLGLLLLSPLLLLLMLLVRIAMGSPVFFHQLRPGRGGKCFKMVKFRTMREARDAAGEPLPDEKRMTPLGDLLRRTSLDELPELWNVVRGEMSLVGPRPLLPEYLPLYTDRQARRHEVRPGITGLAQIQGRNLLAWEDRFELDVWYVDNWSLWLDVVILAQTATKVIRREGISAPGIATATKFAGTATASEEE